MGSAASRLKPRRSKGASLLKVCRQGDVDKADEILAVSPGAAGYCTLEGLSSLHVAAAARRADLLERLLIALRQSRSQRQPKAARKSFVNSINRKNVHGQTPLMLACKAGGADCVRLLLEAGADATLFDSLQQRTALHYAALYGWAEAIEALLEDDSLVTAPDGSRAPLRHAMLTDSQGHHRYVDGRDGYGLAALHLAASQGHLAAVKVLLKHGASLSVRCNIAFHLGSTDPWTPASTPLHFAAAGRGRVVAALLQAAAEAEQDAAAEGRGLPDPRLMQDWRGQRPYDIARSLGFRSLLWALNPRVPLAALLQRTTPRPAVPSLASLAAAALRRQLSCQLAAMEEQLAEARNNTAVALAANGGAARPCRGGGPSREGSTHGGTAALLARLSGGGGGSGHAGLGVRLSGRGCAAAEAAAAPDCRGSKGARGRHSRHASDSGLCCSAPARTPPPVGGSLRGGAAFEFDPLHAASPLAQRACQPSPPAPPLVEQHPLGQQSFQGEQRPLGRRSLEREEQRPGSLRRASLRGLTAPPGLQQGVEASAGCASAAGVAHTATSITSVAGCPVCLDSCLEVTVSPCGHGLCLECAAHLSRADEGGCGLAGAAVVPPLCPLCRGLMGSFALI